MKYISGDGATLLLDAKNYGMHHVHKTDATTLLISAYAGLPGQRLVVSVDNKGADPVITFDTMTAGQNFTGVGLLTFSVDDVETFEFIYRYDAAGTNPAWYIIGQVA
jgi:hypothetical protein